LKSARTPPRSVDEYIAGFPREVQGVLERVRSIVRKALPKAEEGLSYQMPVYKVDGRYVIYFAGWNAHYSLYPVTDRLAAELEDALAPYELSGKGTVRFPLASPVPAKLIRDIARFRAKEAVERGKAKLTAAKKRPPKLPGGRAGRRAQTSGNRDSAQMTSAIGTSTMSARSTRLTKTKT